MFIIEVFLGFLKTKSIGFFFFFFFFSLPAGHHVPFDMNIQFHLCLGQLFIYGDLQCHFVLSFQVLLCSLLLFLWLYTSNLGRTFPFSIYCRGSLMFGNSSPTPFVFKLVLIKSQAHFNDKVSRYIKERLIYCWK